MLQISLLAFFLILLLVFSMSKERGKNTKYARKNAGSKIQKQSSFQSSDSTEVV
jgi:hypothetical protein